MVIGDNMGMIGKDRMVFDDYLKFGKLVDRLSEYCYLISISPQKGLIYAWTVKEKVDIVKEIVDGFKYEIVVLKNNNLYMFKIKW